MMDPWAITAIERARHAEQFASLGPINGFVSGAQAKGFLMQSGLAPMILAQIWGLADMNGDGQMDLNEFSVACKLINLKLKGFDIPSVLPHSILSVPQMVMPVAPIAMTMPQQQHMTMNMPVMSMAHQMPPGVMTSMPMTVMTSMPMAVQAAPMMHHAMSHQQVPVSMPLGSVSNVQMGMEWTVSGMTQAKYTAIFHQTDKARSGFLAGAQARNILLQSGLPQQILAQIWALSDIDGDGKLSLEEFIVSGHLCEIASKGEPMPPTLPQSLVPPRYRKNVTMSDSASTPGSVHGDGMGSPSSFEDKRRENFNKGQAELERRRQSLVDQQRKEEDERKKKEKADAEAREKQRLELERQRLAEWEKQRKDELISHRQNEQDKLLQLKAKHQNLTSDLDTLREKVKSLTTNISDSRTGVSDVKSFIDGMRSSRDTKMQDLNSLKTKLKEQNERLLTVTQEKAQLEAKNRQNAAKIAEGVDGHELTDFEIKKIEKEKEVVLLREALICAKEKETSVKEKHQEIKNELEAHREDLQRIIKSCQDLYSSFDDKRREIRAEKAKRIRELTDPDHAWGNEEPAEEILENDIHADASVVHYRALYDYEARNEDELSFGAGDLILAQTGQIGEPGWFGGELNGKVGWFPEAYVEILGSTAERATEATPTVVSSVANQQARALHDWTATTPVGSISFVRGSVVEVLNQVQSDWWYVKKEDGSKGFVPSTFFLLSSSEIRGSTPTDPPEVENSLEVTEEDLYNAVYPYQSEESGDLHFIAGEVIYVTKKEAEWWTGKIDNRTGVFPFNYVEAVGGAAEIREPAQDAIEIKTQPDEIGAPETVTEIPKASDETSAALKHKKKKKDEGKKLGIAKVVAPYEASSKEQLTLSKGQMVLIRKKTDTGWWQGEIQGDKGKKRQVGWFPASYVKLLESGGSKTDAETSIWLKALFTYIGQHEDELSFEEGAMIKLVSKDEDVWWKGELDGKVGVFPSNYVETVTN